MRHAAIGLAGLLVSSSLGAGELTLAPPKQATLRLVQVQPQDSMAKYAGYVDVRATLVAEWHDGETEGDEKPSPTMDYTLLLDEKAQAELPHFEHHNLTSIAPTNGPSALAMAAGRAVLAKFRARKISRVEVKGKFTVSGLEIGIDCDTP